MKATDKVKIFIDSFASKIVPTKAPIPPPTAKETVKKDGVNASSIDVLTSTSCAIAFEKDSDVDMIICFSESGKIARFLSKQRPK